MHIALTELKHAKQPVERLEIVSLEGRYYMARVCLEGQWYSVTDSDDRVIRFSGACEARDAFHGVQVERAEVLPAAGTDEMIGMPEDHLAPMKVPL